MAAKSKATSDFISTREAARMLGIALRTVQLWVESGVLTAWKTAGGHRRIVRKSVEDMLAQRASALAAVPAPGKGARGLRGRFRLLVVEDEPELLKLFQMTVEGWQLPLDLLTASNGFEGLIRIGEAHPNLLITDLSMPGMDGFRMIRSLRANPQYRSLRTIVVTGLDKRDIADQGGLPADVTIFTKPIPFQEIERIVRAELEQSTAPAARRTGT
jgi:excisionase family DNA binding protein